MVNSFLDWALQLSPLAAAGWLFLANVATFAAAVAFGHVLVAVFARHRIVPAPDALQTREVAIAAAGVVANWLVTVLAWWLWMLGLITIRRDTGWRAWLDVPVLLLLMDFSMYVLHRVVHHPWFYPIHRLHHEYDRPRPLSLFVLNPLETLSFGMLWLLVILMYPSSWLGLSIYLAINLGSGMLGHLGVEPFPRWLARIPILRQIGTSTFHAQHHLDTGHNFGFYTLIWDRLFGTLEPGYDRDFGEVVHILPHQAPAQPAEQLT